MQSAVGLARFSGRLAEVGQLSQLASAGFVAVDDGDVRGASQGAFHRDGARRAACVRLSKSGMILILCGMVRLRPRMFIAVAPAKAASRA